MKWDARKLQWYLLAGQYSEYPRVFISRIKPFLNPSYSLLDIGAGPGLFARKMIPYLKTVYNLEPDPIACEELKKIASNTTKIEILPFSWPLPQLDLEFDITLSAFSGSRVMSKKDSLNLMAKITRKYIFLIAPSGSRGFAGKSKDTTPPYRETITLLDKLGFSYTTEMLSFDFGQPVKSREDAIVFLQGQLKSSPEEAWEYAQKIIRKHPVGFYLPNQRHAAFIKIKL